MELDHGYWIQFIIADFTPVECTHLYMSSPSRQNKFLSEQLFLDCYRNALEEGLLSSDNVEELLKKYGIWNDGKEATLQKLIKDMENIKVTMFESWTNNIRVRELKRALRDTEKGLEVLNEEKQSFDLFSAKAAARYCQQHFLMGCSLYTIKNRPYWKRPTKCWDKPDEVLNRAYRSINKYYLTDNDYREIACGNAWRNVWSTRKGVGNMFGRAVVDLSVPQRHLVAWSNLYDSVYSNSECPTDSVIEDHDALDGWMIKQKRKRDEALNNESLEGKINPRIASYEEVFIPTGIDEFSPVSRDNFDMVYNLNNIEGKIAFKRRMAQIKKEGVVDEGAMLDRQDLLRKQILQGHKYV